MQHICNTTHLQHICHATHFAQEHAHAENMREPAVRMATRFFLCTHVHEVDVVHGHTKILTLSQNLVDVVCEPPNQPLPCQSFQVDPALFLLILLGLFPESIVLIIT